MRFTAVFVILNILLLSPYSSITGIRREKIFCCVEKMEKNCYKYPKPGSSDHCAKRSCNAMMTCGFVVSTTVTILPAIFSLSSQVVISFAIGELSDYHGDGWHPPKI